MGTSKLLQRDMIDALRMRVFLAVWPQKHCIFTKWGWEINHQTLRRIYLGAERKLFTTQTTNHLLNNQTLWNRCHVCHDIRRCWMFFFFALTTSPLWASLFFSRRKRKARSLTHTLRHVCCLFHTCKADGFENSSSTLQEWTKHDGSELRRESCFYQIGCGDSWILYTKTKPDDVRSVVYFLWICRNVSSCV